MLVCCDTCGDTLDVSAYDDDPPRSGWARHKPRSAPGLDTWRCPNCEARSQKRERSRAA
jgi:hypothetical protein